jgi:ribosomal-protein-serine acetyltransferase
MQLPVSANISLELTGPQHAAALFEAVDRNRAHLSTFLPWVGQMETAGHMEQYIARCGELYVQGLEASFVILRGQELVGRIGMHHIQPQNRSGAIGYWLTEAAQGQGIITQSCRTLIAYGFTTLHLHRIEIKALMHNTRSQAVPQRLGFTREGLLRQAEYVNGDYHDLVVFSLLRNEWTG